jgi:16S rRNA (cytidine1402-2'-O)-methyltransferase
VAALVDALAELMPARRITLARELTKQFEEVATLAAGAAPVWLAADANRSRGEFVFVLHAVAAEEAAALDAAAERTLTLLLAELPLKQAVSLASAISGAPRNALYERALALRGES